MLKERDPAPMNTPINILIVDDEPKNLTVLETILGDPDYRLVRAETADQALLALVVEEFALLILDIRMPGMTGFELAQMIKERKKTARVPIIFLTAYYNEDQHVLAGYDSGAVDYLHKPVNPAILRSKVAVFAELYRKNREVGTANRALLAEVAERRRAEQQLRDLNDTLEQRVAERAAALTLAHANLRETAERYRSLFDGSLDAIFSLDANGLFATANPAALRLIGRTLEELKSIHFLDICAVEQREAATKAFRAAFCLQCLTLDTTVITAAGERRDLFISGAPAIVDGAVVGVSCIARDVTERKRSEEAFKAHEALLRTVTDEAQVGLVIISPEHRYLYANGAYARMLGLSTHELVGAPVADVLPDAYATQIRPRLEHAFAGERVTSEMPHPSSSDTTADRQFEFIYQPQKDQGIVKSVVVVVVDLTERKRMEEALRNADRRKDEFLATLAHELRNPLAPVRNAVHLLHLTVPATPVVQWARDVIDRQTQQMTRLIDDLMDLSRISRGRIELRREHVELAKVVQSAVETSQPLIDQQAQVLTVTLPHDRVVLDADPIRLAQVFMNLLNNASKYSEKGSCIELHAERQDSNVVVSVKDAGIGIAANNLLTIFEMFSQVEGALSRAQGGLGIGLCLVKRLVELHGGHIEARSSGPGKGSEFVVRLPIVVEQITPPTSNDDDKTAPLSGLRILVVDDNLDTAASLAMLLKVMGSHVRTANNGEEAVQTAEELRPHVVLCDIGLPKMNGYEVCRHIRQEPWGENMVLIAVTGWGQDDDKRKSEEAGFNRHMVKPVKPQSLMKLLAELPIIAALKNTNGAP